MANIHSYRNGTCGMVSAANARSLSRYILATCRLRVRFCKLDIRIKANERLYALPRVCFGQQTLLATIAMMRSQHAADNALRRYSVAPPRNFMFIKILVLKSPIAMEKCVENSFCCIYFRNNNNRGILC